MASFAPPRAIVRKPGFWGYWQALAAEIYGCFASVQLAILLLSLLSLGTLIGVITPQEGMTETAQIQARFGQNYKFMSEMGLFHVFSSFWFLTLQILFFFNVIIGSLKWLKPATLAAVRRYTLAPQLLDKKPGAHGLVLNSALSAEDLRQAVLSVFRKHGYPTFTGADQNLYLHKASWSRLGPGIAHVGILLCLVAGVYGTLTGFKAQKIIAPGQSFTLQQSDMFKANAPEKIWLGKVPNIRIAVKDFRMEFYKERPDTVMQYYSHLQVSNPKGQVLKDETISVNHPLSLGDLSVYQASFMPTGRFLVKVNGAPRWIESNSQFNNRPISVTRLESGAMLIFFPFFRQQDPGVPEDFGVFFVRNPKDKPTPGKMPANMRLRVGETGVLNGTQVAYVRPEVATGLQIKQAPEVPLMYLSYILLMIGGLLSFFSQRQVWVSFRPMESGKTEILLYPKTNKGRLSFRQELDQLNAELIHRLLPASSLSHSPVCPSPSAS